MEYDDDDDDDVDFARVCGCVGVWVFTKQPNLCSSGTSMLTQGCFLSFLSFFPDYRIGSGSSSALNLLEQLRLEGLVGFNRRNAGIPMFGFLGGIDCGIGEKGQDRQTCVFFFWGTPGGIRSSDLANGFAVNKIPSILRSLQGK